VSDAADPAITVAAPVPAAAAALADRAGIVGIDGIVPFRVVLVTRFRGVDERHGLLLHGASGWGEWSPFDEYDDTVAARWLDAAIEAACVPPPVSVRAAVPVNVTIPAVGPDRARALVAESGCRTAKVKVAEPGQALTDDLHRVAAVRQELGPTGSIRIDANGAWSVAAAVESMLRLEDASGGLEYVEQPCTLLADLAEVRARTGIRIAADEAIRRDRVDLGLLREAVDVAVLKVQPVGGVARALALAAALGLPTVVSSALETSVGLAAGVRLAAALPELPFACGLATGLLLAEDVIERRVLPTGGSIAVSAAAAAAVEVRPACPPPSPEVTRVLMARLERAEQVRSGQVRAEQTQAEQVQADSVQAGEVRP